MNFLNKVAKGAQQGVEIAKLDAIVQRRVQEYENETTEIVNRAVVVLSAEEIKVKEDEIAARCMIGYDREACPYMGRPIQDTWKEGGGDNLEVRKRILSRKLEALRGSLLTQLETKFRDIQAKILLVKNFFQNHESTLIVKLPLKEVDLYNEFSAVPDVLQPLILPHTFQTLDTSTAGQLAEIRKAMENRVALRNKELLIISALNGIEST
jgi:hypothetical protein